VHLGESAEIRLNAYPDKVFTGRMSNVGPVLDPTLHTAKVRVEVRNPGIMRVACLSRLHFTARKKRRGPPFRQRRLLHLHDRDWVYVPIGGNKFRRTEVVAGNSLPDKMQEITSGVKPGQHVVSNALVLQNTVEQ